MDITDFLQNVTFEMFFLAVIVVCLTTFIKIPIKNNTHTLNEDKRKAINSVIVLIPIVLSFVLSILYCGIFENVWFTLSCFKFAINVWALSFILYSFGERTIIISNGIIKKE